MTAPKQFESYEQQYNDLVQAEVHAVYSAKKEKLALDERPLFSKNNIDGIRKWLPWYFAAGFVAGCMFWWAISHL